MDIYLIIMLKSVVILIAYLRTPIGKFYNLLVDIVAFYHFYSDFPWFFCF